ncbi:MAG: hypothetical protein PHC29_08415 [Candidatus Omnitrophica bacterium]|nr:hypothetical protein [Candidatus Omnitrophota bacterium]
MLISDEERERFFNSLKKLPEKIIPRYYENADNARKFYSGAGKILTDVLRAAPRAGAQIALTATGQKEFQPGEFKYKYSPIEDFLFGKEKITDLQTRFKGNKEFAEGMGLGKASVPLAGIGTAVALGMDLTPVNPSGGGRKVAQEAVESAGKRALKKGASKIKVNYYDQAKRELADLVKSQKSAIERATRNGIENSVLQVIDNKTGEMIYKVIPKGDLHKFKIIDKDNFFSKVGSKSYHLTAKTPAEMEAKGFVNAGVATAKEIPNIPKWIKDEYGKFAGSKSTKKIDPLIPESTQVTDALKNEARKFYHGTNFSDNIKKEGFKIKNPIHGKQIMGEGIYLTPTKEEARNFGKEVLETVVNPRVKIMDVDPATHWKLMLEANKKYPNIDTEKAITKLVQEKGYGGIKMIKAGNKGETYISIFNPKDIWIK